VVYRYRGYFGAKSKGYTATEKKVVKGSPLAIRNILRNKRISSKRVIGEWVYAVTLQIFKHENFCHYYSKGEFRDVVYNFLL